MYKIDGQEVSQEEFYIVLRSIGIEPTRVPYCAMREINLLTSEKTDLDRLRIPLRIRKRNSDIVLIPDSENPNRFIPA